ncbi:MAG: hypothetical protein MUF72_16685 [Elainella sp. Prado103]|jgi:hypothetical protein|nr:hypothetical protein [Elainella sp. Prado103]
MPQIAELNLKESLEIGWQRRTQAMIFVNDPCLVVTPLANAFDFGTAGKAPAGAANLRTSRDC